MITAIRPRLLVVALAFAAGACSQNTPAPPTVNQPPPGETITGGEHIGWTQQADDAVELSTIRFAIYVDGARTELTGASCATTPAADGFPCTAPVPAMPRGQHTLELASFTSGTTLESAKTAAIVVTVATAASAAAETWQSGTIVTTADRVALRLDLVAAGLDMPTAIAAAPDGRLFVAERTGGIRVIRPSSSEAPRYMVRIADVSTANGGGIVAMALDPDFDRTHAVDVVYTTADRASSLVFRVARYREAADTLGDGVPIVDAIAAAPGRPAATIGFGPDRKLYAAFDDSGDAATREDRASFNGRVLRLNADGTTPADQPGLRPVFSGEYRSPRGIAWTGGGIMWLLDGGPELTARLVAIAAGTALRGHAVAARELTPPVGAAGLVVYRAPLIPAFSGNLIVAADEGRSLLRVRTDPASPTEIAGVERLLDGQVSGVRAVAVDAGGAIVFATATRVGRLTPVQ